MYSLYHNNRTQTLISFPFTLLSTLYIEKRIIAMKFLDQFDFREEDSDCNLNTV